MSRLTALRRRPLRIARLPRRGAMGFDPSAEREPFQDPRGAGHHSTLPYREAVELLRCMQIMGPDAADHCRHEVLGEPLPPPEFVTAAGISSPVPFGADAVRGGGRSANIGDLTVTLLPDTTSRARSMAGRAETNIRFSTGRITWRLNRAGTVSSINGPPRPTATIRTTYGRGVSATSLSGYGRGTTAADRAEGNTSLGFHEGRHGVDYLRYMAANPYPRFAGAVGMTGDEIRAAMDSYRAALAAYNADLQRVSTENTDCVGDTSSVSNEVRVVCDAMNAAATP
jgi:hypothetical protein